MVALSVLVAALQVASPREWQHTFNADIRAVSQVPLGPCVAVMTLTELAVFDETGQRLWSRNVTPILRWMPWGGAVSVSPQCDWAVIGGSADYRYAWTIEQSGADRFVRFRGESPYGVAISPDGTTFAVSTGAGRLHVFSRGGARMHMTRHAGLATELAYTGNGDILPFEGYGARRFTSTGRLLWENRGLFCTTYAQPGDASISYCVPPHGPGGTLITARTRDGRQQWDKVVLDGQPAEPVRDARRTVATFSGSTLTVRIR